MFSEQQDVGSKGVAVIRRDTYQFETDNHVLELKLSSS